ncbi:extracellular matrix protein 1 [Narcine bancroftii]|uniref:extracellular matrix protein 1 n=1 Tax=Narcine bancroftii TaxID=1343680 RepID=UPI003831EF89
MCRNNWASFQREAAAGLGHESLPHSGSRFTEAGSRSHTEAGSRSHTEAGSRSQLGPVTMWSPFLVLALCALGRGNIDVSFEGQVEITPLLSPEEGDQAMDDVPPQQPTRVTREIPQVVFPLERPDAENLALVCGNLGQRRSYPPGSLPTTGFGYLKRQANAVHRMEAAFSQCCGETESSDRLNCTLHGWMQSLDQFCEEEFSIKTRAYKCCREPREDWHSCFARVAPLHSYEPSSTAWVSGSTAECTTPPRLLFPPPQPDQQTIGEVCWWITHNPWPSLAINTREHQSRCTHAIKALEIGFRRCCLGNEPLPCAQQTWSEVLSSFCRELGGANPCCLKTDACFSERARNHGWETHAISLAAVNESTMQKLCKTPLRVAGRGPENLLVTKIRRKCCRLETIMLKVNCGIKEKTHFVNNACGRFAEEWTDYLACCTQDTVSCFDTRYLARVEVFLKTAP